MIKKNERTKEVRTMIRIFIVSLISVLVIFRIVPHFIRIQKVGPPAGYYENGVECKVIQTTGPNWIVVETEGDAKKEFYIDQLIYALGPYRTLNTDIILTSSNTYYFTIEDSFDYYDEQLDETHRKIIIRDWGIGYPITRYRAFFNGNKEYLTLSDYTNKFETLTMWLTEKIEALNNSY